MTDLEVQQQLEAFKTRLGGIFKAFIEPRNAAPTPALIYHYTDDQGLLGILKTGKLWLNDVFSLNDPKEVEHGYETALNIAFAEARRRDVPAAANATLRALEVLSGQGLRGTAHLFALSFSARGDDLGQWRAYADDGKGFVLAFDGPKLDRCFADSDRSHNNTFAIIYDEAQLQAIQSSLAKAYIDFIANAVALGWEPEEWNFRQAALAAYVNYAISVSLFFKHPAYANEDEFRFLQMFDAFNPAPNLETRTNPYRLVRYREFDWKKVDPGLLKKIMVGPAHFSQAMRFAKDCLEAYHRPGVDVSLSLVPYQGR